MALINVDNSQSVYGKVRSVRLHSESHGDVYWHAEDDVTETRIAYQVLELSDYRATVSDVRAVASYVRSLLNGMDERALYSIQSMLNDIVWKETKIEATANWEHVTGLAIGVKTIWQYGDIFNPAH
jgi:hypothetical protein